MTFRSLSGPMAILFSAVLSVTALCAQEAGTERSTFISIEVPGYVQTLPLSINSRGVITGIVTHSQPLGTGVPHGFVRDRDGSLKVFDAPGVGSGVSSGGTSPASINSSGEITGYYYDSKFKGRGFLRDPNGEIIVFDAPGAGDISGYGCCTFAVSINDGGVVTGFFVDEKYAAHGFIRWPDGKFTEFDVSPELGSETIATSISPRGAIAGVFQDKDGNNEGFVRTADGNFSYFKSPDGTIIADYASFDYPRINREGTVAGWYSVGDGTIFRGFVRTANGDFEEINAPGASATYVDGINAAGEIAGYFVDASLNEVDFVRCRDGHFVIFTPPGTAAGQTMTTSINDTGHVIGSYTGIPLKTLGFLMDREIKRPAD